MSDSKARDLEIPVQLPMPFDRSHLLSIGARGSTTANETYVPQHDIINCVPGAYVAMCKLITVQEVEVAQKHLEISEENMLKAAQALQYILSRGGLSHNTFEEAVKASGINALPWQARMWVLKNLGEVMVRMWFQIAKIRVNNVKEYMDTPIHAAADEVMRSLGRGIG